MVIRSAFLALLVAAVWQGGTALAQQRAGLTSPDARFLNAPDLGERIPDVTIVDDQGNPANLRELARQKPYTVLTLGCLT